MEIPTTRPEIQKLLSQKVREANAARDAGNIPLMVERQDEQKILLDAWDAASKES
ncbi:hypothetical protein ACFJGV_15255 [Cnuibacter sp. UC19_7]|uniref:hypothetical protein n=1 Tax=Cnuibacter sp. UC19_7 TaxID=3350166 RepID=UPI003672D3DC